MDEKDDIVELVFYTVNSGVARSVAVYKVQENIGEEAMKAFSSYQESVVFDQQKIQNQRSPVFRFMTADGRKSITVDLRWFGFIEIHIPTQKSGEVKAKGDNKLKIKKEETDGGS
jgi:hypothetical protein